MIKTRNSQFSLWEYIVRVCFISFFSILLFKIFAEDGNTLHSFIKETIAFFLLTIVTAKILIKDKHLLLFFSIAYLAKVGIGVWHYLTFIDPNYFSGAGETNFMHYEFEAVIQFIGDAAREKNQFGLLHLKSDGYVTHQELLSIIAIPFHFFGVKMLGISPINSFFSLFAAMNVYLVSKSHITSSCKNKCLLLLLTYFPATLLTDYFFRDIVGWCFMSIGLAMMCFSRNMYQKVFAVILAIPLFYLQRNAYIVIPIFLLLLELVVLSPRKNVGVKSLFIIFAVVAIPVVYQMVSNESTDAYIQGAARWPIYMLPVKIIFGLIGPFPWSNFLLYKVNPSFSFYLGDYLSAVLNISILLCVCLRWKVYVNRSTMTIPTFMGLFLLLMGVLNQYMHMTYISIGIFFLIPWIVNYSSSLLIKKYLWYAFLSLLVLNIVVSTLGLSGMSSAVR